MHPRPDRGLRFGRKLYSMFPDVHGAVPIKGLTNRCIPAMLGIHPRNRRSQDSVSGHAPLVPPADGTAEGWN